MACAVYETAPTSLEWKLQLGVRLTRAKHMTRGSWLDVSLFSHVGKAIRDIWLVYIGLRTKIYSATQYVYNKVIFLSLEVQCANQACEVIWGHGGLTLPEIQI